jgi:hypothetical protein
MNKRFASMLALLICFAATTSTCGSVSSPPGASSYTGIIDELGYVLHAWEEGLKILVVYDTPNAYFCEGEGGSSASTYRLTCSAESNDGRTTHWEIETADGVQAVFSVERKTYQVVESAVFLLHSGEDEILVERITRDLSSMALDHDAIITFITGDEELHKWLDEAQSLKD